MPSIIQRNFLGGELDSTLWGRGDLALFGRGLRTLRNFFVRRQGAAVSRPGTKYLAETKTQSSDPNVRLVPFVFSDDTSYVLEIGVDAGELYVRFFTDEAPVTATYLRVENFDANGSLTVTDFSAGNHITGSSSLATATIVAVVQRPEVGGGTALQLKDVVGAFTPSEVITEAETLTLYDVAIAAEYVATYEVPGGATAADLAKLKWTQSGDIIFLVHPDFPALELRRLGGNEWTLTQTSFATATPYFPDGNVPVLISPLPVADATHPEKEWDFYVTLTVRDITTGQRFETQAWAITESWDDNIANPSAALGVSPKFALYPDKPITISTAPHLPVDEPRNVEDLSYTVEAVNYYRGRGLLRGYVGSTTLFGEFIDIGDEPNYAVQPPRGTNPFQETAYTGVAPPDQYPFSVAFFQERLAYAGTKLRGNAVFLSATGDYRNFDLPSIIHFKGEALLYELAARQFEQARHLFSDAKLLVLTGASVWSMNGDQGNALDFDHVDVRLEDNVGASHLPPIAVDGTILFGRSKGFGVRSLRYNGQTYAAAGVSDHSQHLFLGESVVSGNRYSKTLVDWTYAEDPWGLVWACRNDGVLLSLTHVGEAFAWARHDCDGARFLRACAVPETTEDGVYLVVQREIGGSVVNCIERMNSRVRYGNGDDDGAVDCCVKVTIDVAVEAERRIQLAHLDGETVWVTGVGNAPAEYVVGTDEPNGYFVPGITLSAAPTPNSGAGGVGGDSATLYVGLLFVCDLETLDVASAEAKLKQKTVTRVGFELDQSAGILGGQDFDHLTETRPHTVASGYSPPVPATALQIITPLRTWGEGGRAVLRQTLPLPVTVVGLVRDIDVGG